MQHLTQIYHPIVARPFERKIYREIPPCAALRPYIRCFWEQDGSRSDPWLVVPDTCADLIFKVSPDGKVQHYFCGIGDAPFWSQPTANGERTFGVRFYGWSAALFAGETLRGTANGLFETEAYFPWVTGELLEKLAAGKPEEEAALLEQVLCRQLESVSPDGNFMQAVYRILSADGNLSLRDLSFETALSARQLERLFSQNLGLSPKKLAELVRYQLLWQQMLLPGFDPQDAVERFGFYDQSHLLHAFKRCHGLSPAQALRLAGR